MDKYNSKVYTSSTTNKILFIPLLIGVIFMVASIIATISLTKEYTYLKEEGVSTIAVITNIDREKDSDGDVDYNVFIEYNDNNGRVHNVRLNHYNSSMDKGDEINILYDKNNPKRFIEENAILVFMFPAIFGLLSIVILLVGITFTTKAFLTKKRIKRLINFGVKDYAIITSVDYDTSVRINGAGQYILKCKYDAPDGRQYVMQSQRLKIDVGDYLDNDQIIIYYDKDNISDYYISVAETLEQSKTVLL